MDKLITTIDKPAEMDLKISQIITLTEKNHSKLANLDYESSGHTGFASQKDLEEVMSVASGKSRSFTVQSVQDLGTLFGIEITSSEEEYTVTKSQIVYNGENVNLQNGYVFYIVDDGPDYWFSKDNMKLYATEGLGGGIEELVGTEEKPINWYSDLEVGKLYILKGYATSYQATSKIFIGTILALKEKEFEVVTFGAFQYNSVGPSVGNAYGQCKLNIRSDGSISSSKPHVLLNKLNGTMGNSDIYAPTSGGTAGQILQSNGNSAPTWVDQSELGLATLDDITNAIGNVSALLGDTDDLEV